jgi:hypothetical protein
MRHLLLVLLLGSFAFAITYRVAGGDSATLLEEVKTAFASWLELDPELEISEAEEAAEVLIHYGESERFGPDVLSLTLQRPAAEQRLEVMINASKETTLKRVLLHETGLILGLASAGEGVMNPAVKTDEVLSLGDSEKAALEALQNVIKEDINRDGVVSFYDLAALAKVYGQSNLNDPADLSGDGIVDQDDLDILKAAYQFGDPSAEAPQTPEEAAEALESEDPANETSEEPASAEGATETDPEPEENQEQTTDPTDSGDGAGDGE